jgi:hypothetical protein
MLRARNSVVFYSWASARGHLGLSLVVCSDPGMCVPHDMVISRLAASVNGGTCNQIIHVTNSNPVWILGINLFQYNYNLGTD